MFKRESAVNTFFVRTVDGLSNTIKVDFQSVFSRLEICKCHFDKLYYLFIYLCFRLT